MNEQYEHMRQAIGVDIFERRGGRGEPGGFRFVCPGVMFGADNVTIAFEGRWWHLSYTDEAGHTYHGYCTSQVGAYLALIADRYGLTAVIGEPTEGDPA